MDLSETNYYLIKKMEIKVAKWGTSIIFQTISKSKARSRALVVKADVS
jgi:hypothetical protein